MSDQTKRIQRDPKGEGLRNVTVAALAAAKKLPVDFHFRLGLEDHPRGGVMIPYTQRRSGLT